MLGAMLALAAALMVALRSRNPDSSAKLAVLSPGLGADATPASTMRVQVVGHDAAASIKSEPPTSTAAVRPGGAAKAARIPPARIPAPDLPEPSAESREQVRALWLLEPAGDSVSAETAAEWKQSFEKLVQGGVASVSALAEFLRLNQDKTFSADDAALLGYGSARAAALDALIRIGGPEAIGVLGEVLQTTATPREVAMLARTLQALAPEQYRAQAVEAARQSLAMAVQKQLEGYDVAPLFEVLQSYGGADIIDDLEGAMGQWSYYAAVALGNLPDGVGVEALIRSAELGPDGRSLPARSQALQVLAEMAVTNPEARAALIQQARANQIATPLWPALARPLAGDRAHVQESVLNDNLSVLAAASTGSSRVSQNNQNFFYAPAGGSLTAQQVNQQLALVNQLAGATSNPDALQVLAQARALLEQRLAGAMSGAVKEGP